MAEIENSKKNRLTRNIFLLLSSGLVGAIAVYLLWQTNPDPAYWKALLDQVLDFLEANPWALLVALATLPGIGFPISPLFILVGGVLAPQFGMPIACLLGILAQSICTTWTYLLASGPLRNVLVKLVQQKRELPQLNKTNAIRLCLILRITPGVPYALQNIVLGVIGMQMRTYLLVSLPITGLWTIGFIVTGGAIFEGQVGLSIFGILLLVVLVLATKMLRRKTQIDNG
ncbi:MAG: VTT domain-containing protein [Verrucomicrobiota bacterium]